MVWAFGPYQPHNKENGMELLTNEYLLIAAIAALTFLVWRMWSTLDRLADAHNNNADVLHRLLEELGKTHE